MCIRDRAVEALLDPVDHDRVLDRDVAAVVPERANLLGDPVTAVAEEGVGADPDLGATVDAVAAGDTLAVNSAETVHQRIVGRRRARFGERPAGESTGLRALV